MLGALAFGTEMGAGPHIRILTPDHYHQTGCPLAALFGEWGSLDRVVMGVKKIEWVSSPQRNAVLFSAISASSAYCSTNTNASPGPALHLGLHGGEVGAEAAPTTPVLPLIPTPVPKLSKP